MPTATFQRGENWTVPMIETADNALSHSLKPLCPRDDHRMHYERRGITWNDPGDHSTETLASYHCDFEGCSVRYSSNDGYFTVVNTPDQPFFIEEPGVNLHRCPRHGGWLYRAEADTPGARYEWRCGSEACDYVLLP